MNHQRTTSEIADRIAELTYRGGLSKRAVARGARIPFTTYLRRVNGGTSFTIDELHSIARSLEVPVSSLLPEREATP